MYIFNCIYLYIYRERARARVSSPSVVEAHQEKLLTFAGDNYGDSIQLARAGP
jgi:hypothetical protein